MGSSSSVLVNSESRRVNDIVNTMMPLYYQNEAVTQDDIYVAENTWRLILEGNAPMMSEMRQLTGLHDSDGMDLFRELFFVRFFDVHELAMPLFSEKAVRSGKFIGSMLQMCFKQLENPKLFRKKMVELTESQLKKIQKKSK